MPAHIAATASLAAGSTTPVAVTARSGGIALPGATVYLKFQPTVGGGSASVGTVPLTTTVQAFVADASGQVTVSYRTPAVRPGGGHDLLTAQNAASGATAQATSTYYFTPTAHWLWLPEPIAAPGSLPASSHAPVSVTALDGANAPVPGAQICLTITRATGGGSAAVGGVVLTSRFQCFAANANGVVAITYSTPAVLPKTGTDVLTVRDTASTLYNTTSWHGYSFGALSSVTFSPTPIAVEGSLAPGAKVVLTLTPRDATGAKISGATFTLALRSAAGAHATVSNYAADPGGSTLSATPRTFLSHTNTAMQITYRISTTPPASGVDYLDATVVLPSGDTRTITVQYTY
ncbi:MAG TPA: hypothetical protein VGN48_15270 [Pedococcus sp.]|jgi:hypothetical protein|nr:hypothetical protein [Pedococcus sp.]